MPTMELVQSKGGDAVFFSVNRLQRYHVPDPKTLKDYQFWMRGLVSANPLVKPDVQVVDNLNAFGALVK